MKIADAIAGKHDVELNIAILEWLGWKWMHRTGEPHRIWLFPPDATHNAATGFTGCVFGTMQPTSERPAKLSVARYGTLTWPDHIKGTAAHGNMHAAICKLRKDGDVEDVRGDVYGSEAARYVVELWCVMNPSFDDLRLPWPFNGASVRDVLPLLTATARQQAVAFLLTVKEEIFEDHLNK